MFSWLKWPCESYLCMLCLYQGKAALCTTFCGSHGVQVRLFGVGVFVLGWVGLGPIGWFVKKHTLPTTTTASVVPSLVQGCGIALC